MTECLFDLIKQGATVRQLQLVLESETNLECRNDRQETPLMAAMLNIHEPAKREKIMLLLIEYNANINCLNTRGQTPLMYASILNLTREIKILLNEPRVQCNSQDYEGNTALMYACAMGKLDAIETLVDAGCSGQITLDPYIMNMDGTSAFDYARDSPDDTILKLLRRLIANNNVYNYDNEQKDLHPSKSKSKTRGGKNKSKSGKSKRIQQLADDVMIDTRVTDHELPDDHQVVVWKGDENGHPAIASEPDSAMMEPAAESGEIIPHENKIPKKKSVIMNIHLPRTYDDDFNTDSISTDAMSITEVRPPSKTSKCVVDNQLPSTSGCSASVNSSPKTKQRKRKGKRLRKKKRVQSENVKGDDLTVGYPKPKNFGEEIAFCNKIYGADLYPCSTGPDECYGDVDKMIAKIKRKVTGSLLPPHTPYTADCEGTNSSKQTGKMDCLKLSATERAKLLSRTIWSVYGTPLPPIPITVETVHRVMSGITRLQHHLGRAKYQPGRLLSLDPEMWCIVESIKSESNTGDKSALKT